MYIFFFSAVSENDKFWIMIALNQITQVKHQGAAEESPNWKVKTIQEHIAFSSTSCNCPFLYASAAKRWIFKKIHKCKESNKHA